MIDISGENVVLVGALLLFVAVMAGKVAYRFGAPALLLFLGVGMLFGLDFISYRSVDMTQFVGMIALCIILFTGGMDTCFQEIKPIIGPGVVLATVGVVMTAVVLAGFVWLIAPWIGLADLLPAGPVARLHDVFDRLGVGVLHPAKQETGTQTAPAPAAGAGERFERPDGLHDDDSADQHRDEHLGRRRYGHEHRLFRDPDDRRRPVGLPDRPAGGVDDQQDQPRQPLALFGASAGFHLLRLRLHRPRSGATAIWPSIWRVWSWAITN